MDRMPVAWSSSGEKKSSLGRFVTPRQTPSYIRDFARFSTSLQPKDAEKGPTDYKKKKVEVFRDDERV